MTVTLRGANHLNVGTPTEPETGPPIPFTQVRTLAYTVGVTPAPTFTLTEPAEGETVDLDTSGGQVDVALTLAGSQFYPLTVNIAWDGHTTTDQITSGTQYRRTIDLAPMPLTPRPISVNVANLDSVSAPQTGNVGGRDIGLPVPVIVVPDKSANLVAETDGTKVVSMSGTAADSQSGMAGGSARVAWALSPPGPGRPAQPRPATTSAAGPPTYRCPGSVRTPSRCGRPTRPATSRRPASR